jgi:hypothetical protein
MSPVSPGRSARHGRAIDDLSDTAIDFVDMASIVDRIREEFFAERRQRAS